MNFVINSIIIPDFLENGLLDIGVSYNNTKFDDLIIDMTLPSEPVFFNQTIDVFSDGAVYFKKSGPKYTAPTTPMRFQLDEENLQLVISKFSVNQVV